MRRVFIITLSIMSIMVLFVLGIAVYSWITHEPNWHVEKNAVPSSSHPLAGFWKGGNCDDPWGWAIGPAGEGLYYISFCSPGGCFKEGTYLANTPIYSDPKYKVVDNNTIEFLSEKGWTTHIRCPGREISDNAVSDQ